MATKITPKIHSEEPAQEQQLDPAFSNLEFSRRADELIGLIKRHYRMIEGEAVSNEQTLDVATKILQERLK